MSHTLNGNGLADALARLRGEQTQELFARDMGIDQTTLSRLLRGGVPGPQVRRALLRRYPELRDAVAESLVGEAV